ncbi:head GIN domain-containing protein [Hymenobacter edaphi]|uniref:Putative auto-transporter adhesin head GIN domain-containing protein n=1 Tax=Hymenobacter edaphi TaxID=2211146 RepID=A0A328BNL7_9BACT|nr:head GIN domain-containing protein [Hymenobacter edaphi]RAK68189.1 hypothetical protein DLM85_09130 [Hymenobacter edaphi]
MKRLFSLRSAALAATFIGASALAALAQEGAQLRPVGSFEQVRASGAINVVLRQGPAEVKVEATPEVLAQVRTEVEGNTLKIYREKSGSFHFGKTEKVTVYVTSPRLSGIEVSGASDVKGASPISAEQFSIKVSGASDVTLQLTARQLTAHASGASDIRLTGRVERQQVHVSGASDYRAYELQSQQAQVEASGASDAFVYVDGELNSHSSGASDVHYKGKARLK